MNRFIIILSIILVTWIKPLLAQVNAATLQVVFLYSSIKYLEWPTDELSSFEIQVVGDGEIFDELVKISKSRKVGNRGIIVRKLNSISEITRYHIVFIISTTTAQLEKLVSAANNFSTLIVTSKDGLIDSGSDLLIVQATYYLHHYQFLSCSNHLSTL
jgi:hypothetical protein